MKAHRILLVEDDVNDAELMLAALQESHIGNEVYHVTDGAEALDYLYRRGRFAERDNGHPVVIFLDLKMPKVDGIQVLREVKSDAELRTIPIVVMTSSKEDRDILETYRLGVNAYVVKPVDFDQFAQIVKQLGLFWLVVNEPPPGSVGRR